MVISLQLIDASISSWIDERLILHFDAKLCVCVCVQPSHFECEGLDHFQIGFTVLSIDGREFPIRATEFDFCVFHLGEIFQQVSSPFI